MCVVGSSNHFGLRALLDKRAVCAFLGVAPSTLDRLLGRGVIPYYKLGRSRTSAVRIRRDEMLVALGLVESSTHIRPDQQLADAEFEAVAARLGLRGAGGEGRDG